MSTLTHIPSDQVHGELADSGIRPGADNGNPLLSTLPVDPGNGAKTGIWECRPGGWPIVDRRDTEICFILSGKARITDDETGETTVIEAGSFLVLPIGWTGRWDVTETIRKIYVIC